MDREELKVKISGGDERVKIAAVTSFLKNNQQLRDYHFAHKLIYDFEQPPGKVIKAAILSSFTFDQIQPLLGVESYRSGFPLSVYIGGFNQYEQEIINPSTQLYEFKPQIILLALRIDDILPEFRKDFISFNTRTLNLRQKEILENFRRLIGHIRKNSSAKILFNNFSYPLFLANGIYEHQYSKGQLNWIDNLNRMLSEMVQGYSDVYIFDFHYH